jgi:hypothetical protein
LSTVESSARGRDANTAYLYERIAEGDHEHAEQPDSPHVMRRGTSHDAAQLVRGIIAARDDRARTAHQVAASTDREGISPTGYAASPTAAPTPFNPGGRPTGTGTRKPRNWRPSGSAGSTNTSVATAAKIRASTTASTSSRSGVRPHGFPATTVGRLGAGFPSSGGVETGYGQGCCGRGRRRRCDR